MMSRFWPMFRKEFIQMRRDRLTFAMMVGIPVIQLLVFGYAIQTDVRNLPTVVLDQSRTPTSRDLIAAFQNTGNFRVIAHVDGRIQIHGQAAASTKFRSRRKPTSPDFSGWNCVAQRGPCSRAAAKRRP